MTRDLYRGLAPSGACPPYDRRGASQQHRGQSPVGTDPGR